MVNSKQFPLQRGYPYADLIASMPDVIDRASHTSAIRHHT